MHLTVLNRDKATYCFKIYFELLKKNYNKFEKVNKIPDFCALLKIQL